ncbi:MAG: ABC transporter permease [Gammaproteobacteria bacterium]|nr:ABC transporter permease [Gammaproteobacteria bacterium]
MNIRTNLTAYKTIVYKEILRFIRIWLQTIIPPAVMMSLYFIIFGRLIGEQIGDVQQFTYMDYIVPGLILMSVITNSYANVVSSFYSTKFHRHIEELLISPISNFTIIAGYISGGVARGVCVGSVVAFVAWLFTDIQLANPVIAIIVIILTAILFSLGGFINAIFANSFDDISIVPTFVLTPLTYLGGVFYSIEMLSPFWQQVSSLNPVMYMVNLFRYGLLGISDTGIMTGFLIIIAFILLLGFISLLLLKKGIGIKS